MGSVIEIVNSKSEHSLYVASGRPFMIDCVGGAAEALSDDELFAIRDIYFTHTHLDHISGLLSVLERALRKYRTLNIHGPEGIREVFSGIVNSVHSSRHTPYKKMAVTELRKDGSAERTVFSKHKGTISVKGIDYLPYDWVNLDHTAPCVGYSIPLDDFDEPLEGAAYTAGGPEDNSCLCDSSIRRDVGVPEGIEKVVYITDTRLTPEIAESVRPLLDSSSRLYLESTFPTAEDRKAADRGHMTTFESALLIDGTGVGDVNIINPSAKYVDSIEKELKEILPGARFLRG